MADNFQKFDEKHLQFRHPFTLTISGSTGSGKSEWVMRMLRNLNALVSEPISEIFYCYGELNPNIIQLQKSGHIGGCRVVVHAGSPTEDQVNRRAKESDGKLLMVLDDLMVGMGQQFLDTVFTRGSHNWGGELRVARNNSHYLVLMRNPAGALQVRTLASQLFPSKNNYFTEAYRDATEKQFGYLLIDMHPESPELLRLKTNIYGEQGRRRRAVKHNMNVSPLMLKNADFLRHFRSKYRSKSSQRQMIENALDEQLLCFVEMCFNVLKGRVPLGKRQIQRLGELKHQLRSLARARCAK
ncbi:hypothetical protein niasHT_014790 [Heterodera trifolii]|uniref:Uncharacterized protein n=1 Tax=Heterodera trifolii TaxID=157864 RepID=A0ABD2L6T0_9BILA